MGAITSRSLSDASSVCRMYTASAEHGKQRVFRLHAGTAWHGTQETCNTASKQDTIVLAVPGATSPTQSMYKHITPVQQASNQHYWQEYTLQRGNHAQKKNTPVCKDESTHEWYAANPDEMRSITVFMSRDLAVETTSAAVPHTAKMLPQSIALPGVNSGSNLIPLTRGVSRAAFCCFSSLIRS